MMNERERRDMAELLEYYHDMEKRIQRIQHLCKFLKDRRYDLKDQPIDCAVTDAMYVATHQCLEILRGYLDEED